MLAKIKATRSESMSQCMLETIVPLKDNKHENQDLKWKSTFRYVLFMVVVQQCTW